MNHTNNNFKNLSPIPVNVLREFSGKHVRLILANGFKYETSNFTVFNEGTIFFTDRKGDKVCLSADQIIQISEVKNEL